MKKDQIHRFSYAHGIDANMEDKKHMNLLWKR